MVSHSRLILLQAFIAVVGVMVACAPPRRIPDPLPPHAVVYDSEQMAARVADARERRGEHYARRLALFIEDTPNRQPGGTVFVGDSITEGFPLEQAFAGRNVINRGIGGDVVDGVRERLDVSVADLYPSRVYLMIGINNLAWLTSVAPDDLIVSYEELLKEMKAAAPQAEIVVQSVLPLGKGREAVNPRLIRMNELLRDLAARHGVEWLDLYPRFLDEEDMLRSEFTTDAVHLTLLGYLAWMEAFASPEEMANAVAALSSRWIDMHGNPRSIAGRNRARGENELIVYTREAGMTTTETNQWGVEAAVSGGRVIVAGGNDLEIPADGFVVSGHGRSAAWVSANLHPGAEVMIEGDRISFVRTPYETLTVEGKLDRLMSLLFNAIAQSTGDPPARQDHVDLMTRLYNLRHGNEPVDEAALRILHARLMGMQ